MSEKMREKERDGDVSPFPEMCSPSSEVLVFASG